ncbi:YsnF/AvaK domain-containing protein [Neolewinella antarctica]|uniref:Stress response protein YsnF n=1 Tax=Neolewinella antarctica TaxID=442734 RepID=A0ABX0X6D1_9BACT|nr:DUF2382 domain-containing protein [Neolewinella antarctica]NJC24758.1 stress response protein YsnF [Neolewinella antarctica]
MTNPTDQRDQLNTTTNIVVPVIEERLTIDKVETVTGQVNVSVSPSTTLHSEAVELSSTTYRQETHPVDRLVDERPEIRYEGNITIIPVIQEEVIMVKRLRLVEEIYLIKETSTENVTKEIELRKDVVTINRDKPTNTNKNI